MLRSLFNRLRCGNWGFRSCGRTDVRRPTRFQPQLTVLEERCVMSVAAPTITQIPFQSVQGPGIVAAGITPGILSNGHAGLYFTETGPVNNGYVNHYGEMDLTTGAINDSTTYPIVSGILGDNFGPLAITTGLDGQPWFAGMWYGNDWTHFPGNVHQDRLYHGTDHLTEYDLGPQTLPSLSFIVRGLDNGPTAITAGPGNAVWIVETGQLERIDAASGAIRSTPVGGLFDGNIVTGPDGQIWFTNPATKTVGAYNPSTNSVWQYTLNGSLGRTNRR